MKNGRPVLVVWELHHLGDALMAFPFLKGVAEGNRVVVVCRTDVGLFLNEFLPAVETLAWNPPWLPGGSWRGVGGLLKKVRALRPGGSLSVWPDPRVHLLMRFSGAPRRTGFCVSPRNVYLSDSVWMRRRLRFSAWAERTLGRFSGPWLTETLDKADPQQAHGKGWHQLATHLGTPWRDEIPWLVPAAGSVPHDLAEKFDAPRRAGRKVVLIHPGARHPARRWPRERYEELARLLVAEGWAVVWVEDGADAAPVDFQVLARPTLAGLAAAAAAADLVIANDSFPAHLAAAMGTPVVTIFTSQNVNWFAPWNNRALVVQRDVCPHRPCIDHCVMPSFICRDAVTVGDVFGRVMSLGGIRK